MASSLTQRLDALEERADKAETELKKLKGTVTAHGVALKDKDK
jgi:uncharacterized coiled-coil protein SlyX